MVFPPVVEMVEVHAGEGQVITAAVVVVATVALARDEAAMTAAPETYMDASGELAVS